MASYKALNYQHVMSRMEWFRDLKLIFNKLLTEEDVLTPVDRNLLVKELGLKAMRLELKSPEEYFTKSKVQAFSLAEILAHIEGLDSAVNFDQLIDSLIYLSMNKKKREKKLEELKIEEPKQEKTEKVPQGIRIVKPEKGDLKPCLKENNRVQVLVTQNPTIKVKSLNVIRSVSPINESCLDLNFPEQVLFRYPEMNAYEKLLYLCLAGNSLADTNFPFPQTIIGINLSCNQLTSLNFVHEMRNLAVINVTNNQISRIFSVNQIKFVKEVFIGTNCMSNLNLFCHLSDLHLLDCSNNEIESFEDIAGLVISKRLNTLKLKGNPLSSKENYEKIVQSILPRIYNLDPLNLINLSNFKNFGLKIFAPLKDSEEEDPEKILSKKLILSSNKIEKISTPEPNMDKNFHSNIPKSQRFTVSKTPITVSKPGKMRRSNSQMRIDKSKLLTSTTKTSINLNEKDEFQGIESELFSGCSMIDIAERRIKVYKEEAKGKHNVSVVSNETIQNVKKKVYGNPVAAMMIGPPAVGQGKIRAARTPCFSVDLSRGKKK